MTRPELPFTGQDFLEKVVVGQDLLQRVTKLETHREYAATREEAHAAAKKVDDRLSDLATAVATINVGMATKTWVLGSVIALFFSLAAAALHAFIRAKLG